MSSLFIYYPTTPTNAKFNSALLFMVQICYISDRPHEKLKPHALTRLGHRLSCVYSGVCDLQFTDQNYCISCLFIVFACWSSRNWVLCE